MAAYERGFDDEGFLLERRLSQIDGNYTLTDEERSPQTDENFTFSGLRNCSDSNISMIWDDVFLPDTSIHNPAYASSPLSPIIFPRIPPNQISLQEEANEQGHPSDPLQELSAMVDSLLSEEPSQSQDTAADEPVFLGRAYDISLNPSPNLFLGRAYDVSLNVESLNLSAVDQAEVATSHIY